MSTKKITELAVYTTPSFDDIIPIVDDPSGSPATKSLSLKYLTSLISHSINVVAYGAIGDGVANDTTAIQAAIDSLTSGGQLFFPAGTYKVTSLSVAIDNIIFIGESRNLSIISSSATNLPVISIDASVSGFEVYDLKVTRSVTAIAGGNGIEFVSAGGTGSNERCILKNLLINNHYHGILLGPTYYSVASDIIAWDNVGDGIRIEAGTDALTTIQWELYNIVSQTNSGNGFSMVAGATAPSVTLGSFINLHSFANAGYGLVVAANAATHISDIRVNSMFCSSDNLGGILINSYGKYVQLSNIFVEYAGMSTCGVGRLTAAGGVAQGISISANNDLVILNNIHTFTNSDSGIWTDGPRVIASNIFAVDNGYNTTKAGIYLSSGNLWLSNSFSGNIGTANQDYGIFCVTDTLKAFNIGFLSNGTADISGTSSASIGLGIGDKLLVPSGSNKASGTVTLSANTTSTAVNNTLITANSLVYLFPVTAKAAVDIGSATGVYISAKVAGTSFTITHPNTADIDKVFNYLIIN